MRQRGSGRPAWFVAAMLAAAWAFPAAAQEGYDPLRQITAQMMKANLLILQDRTGSMAWAPTAKRSPTAGGTGTGNLYWGTDGSEGYGYYRRGTWRAGELTKNDGSGTQVTWPASQWTYNTSTRWTATSYTLPTGVGPSGLGGNCDPQNASSCQTWSYVLVFEYPTRMSMVKNVFGATVDIFGAYAAPVAASSFAGDWAVQTVTVTAWDNTVPITQQAPFPFWVYTINYGMKGNTPNRRPNPGAPFAPMDAFFKPFVDASGSCTVGTCQVSKAKDLITTYSDRVNWGLVYFDDTATTAVGITPSGTPSSDVAKLRDYYRADGDPGPSGVAPLSPGGSTDTIGGFAEAKKSIQTAIASDTKMAACGRPYGVLLVTDGLSNSGNPNGGNWLNACGTAPPRLCDGGTSGSDCPSNWSNFAASAANDLFSNTPTGKPSVAVRTWSIGVSVQVGPCELDYIAYMGRTDASSPNGDTGWGGYDSAKNPYLPNVGGSGNDTPVNVPAVCGTSTAGYPTTNSNYDGPTGCYQYFKDRTKTYDPQTTGHGHNAFFATNASDLADAIEAIVNATAAGDYTTNAPTSGQSVGLGTQIMLPTTEFPGWRGHLWAFDTTLQPSDPKYVVWDAGDQLAKTSPAARQIYTWDASKNLVLIDNSAKTVSTLAGIAGAYGLSPTSAFTQQVVNFILGYDVNAAPAWSAPRAWVLGPMINTTPAIESHPNIFHQTNVQAHAPFESLYANRHPLVWAGSDDGMMHAFDFNTGQEVLAILPPNLLPLQVQLYGNYIARKTGTRLTGQPDQFSSHLYGVANSLRFADVYFQSDKSYHTVGIVSEGPGGDMIAAIDITHPSSTDAGYVKGQPFSVLWSVTGATLAGLQKTWSVPVLGPSRYDTWDLVLGSGFDPFSTAPSPNQPTVYTADLSANPASPSFNSTKLTNRATPNVLVGNQAFADANAFSTLAPAFHSDNIVNLGLHADLNGQIWFRTGTDLATQVQVGIDASAVSGLSTQQPIYYSPAVTGYGSSMASCDVFAFGSGTLYEKSPLVTGSAVGSDPNFIPSLFLAVNAKPASGSYASPVDPANVLRIPIQGDPKKLIATWSFGPHTQLTASPFVISPISGTGPVQVLFLVYDPDAGCRGNSYVISLTFDIPDKCGKVTVLTKNMVAWDAGPGAASGFAIAGNTLLVAKSGLGTGVRASLYTPPNVVLQTGSTSNTKPVWWKEHK